MDSFDAAAKRLECAAAKEFEADETGKTFPASFKTIAKVKHKD